MDQSDNAVLNPHHLAGAVEVGLECYRYHPKDLALKRYVIPRFMAGVFEGRQSFHVRGE